MILIIDEVSPPALHVFTKGHSCYTFLISPLSVGCVTLNQWLRLKRKLIYGQIKSKPLWYLVCISISTQQKIHRFTMFENQRQ